VNLLDRLAADASRADSVRVTTAVVTSVGPGRFVDLDVDGGAIVGIPVADSFPSPANGDVCLVLKTGGSWVVIASLGKTPTVGGPNLLTNDSFEFGAVGSQPSGWTNFWAAGSHTKFLVTGGQKHAGDRSIVGGLSGASAVIREQVADPFPVAPGVQYRLGLWYRISAAAPADARVGITVLTAETGPAAQYFSTDPTFLSSSALSTAPAAGSVGAWAYAEVLWTAPSSVSGLLFARPDFSFSTGATSWTGSVWIDDVSFRTAT
jgi:hypothetical protein